MSSPRNPTVHVPPSDHTTVFHTSPRCRHCPPSARTTSRSAARRRGLIECEACYEQRLQRTELPFTLASSPRPLQPLSVSGFSDFSVE
jgi:hypothetical protein